MNKSALILTHSQAEPNGILSEISHALSHFPIRLALVGLLLFAYSLPWITASTASMTLGGYDLAEWASLHPQVRASNPTLLVSFLLRAPLLCAAIILATSATASNAQRRLKLLLVILLSIALLPPLEFFRGAGGDVNFRQQFSLALATLLIAGGISLIQTSRFHKLMSTLSATGGIVCSVLGLWQAYEAVKQFHISAGIGGGFVICLLVFVAIFLSELYSPANK